MPIVGNAGVWTGCRPWSPGGACCTLHMTGSAPFGRTWCRRSCARPHPTHHTLRISLQYQHVRSGGNFLYLGLLHASCAASHRKFKSVLKPHRVSRNFRADLRCRYDTFITVYMSDCDFYPRVRSAGWKTLQYSDFCPDMSPRVRIPPFRVSMWPDSNIKAGWKIPSVQ